MRSSAPRAPINPPNSTTINPYSSSDQDFYCSFTNLPNMPTTNLDELPYTIYSPYSLDRMRERLYRQGQPQHQFPGYERPTQQNQQGRHQRTNSRDHVSSFHSVSSRTTNKSGNSTATSSSGSSFWSIWSMARSTTSSSSASTAATSVMESSASLKYDPPVEDIDTEAMSSALTTTRNQYTLDSDGEIDDDLPPKKKRRTTILKGATSWLPGLGLGRGKHDAALNVAAAGILLKNSRKPSTLDFRCIGTMDEMVARKSVETLSLMGIPAMKEVCGPTASDAEATEKENEKEKEREKEQQKEKEKKLSGLGRLRKWARTEIKPEKSKKRDIGAMQKPRESMDPSYDAPKLDWREPQVARDADWKRNWFIGID